MEGLQQIYPYLGAVERAIDSNSGESTGIPASTQVDVDCRRGLPSSLHHVAHTLPVQLWQLGDVEELAGRGFECVSASLHML